MPTEDAAYKREGSKGVKDCRTMTAGIVQAGPVVLQTAGEVQITREYLQHMMSHSSARDQGAFLKIHKVLLGNPTIRS